MSSEVRLIDANALKTVLCASKCGVIDPASCEYGCMDVMCIDNAPTIDAVEVVRCKDCRFGHSDISIGGETCWICGLTGHVTTEYGYCDEGVNRDAESD